MLKYQAVFWLVWCPEGQNKPKKRHMSYKEAKKEAVRLARYETWKQFYVLKAVHVCNGLDFLKGLTTREEAAEEKKKVQDRVVAAVCRSENTGS